jgi:hypothetical protein
MYSRRRSSIRRCRNRAHGRIWRELLRSLGVDDQRGRPLTRWWTICGRRRCSSCTWSNRKLRSRMWRNRCRCGRAWHSWGCLSHVRRSRHRRGHTVHKSRRDCRCGQRSHKWLKAWGNHRGGLAGHRGGRTCRGVGSRWWKSWNQTPKENLGQLDWVRQRVGSCPHQKPHVERRPDDLCRDQGNDSLCD